MSNKNLLVLMLISLLFISPNDGYAQQNKTAQKDTIVIDGVAQQATTPLNYYDYYIKESRDKIYADYDIPPDNVGFSKFYERRLYEDVGSYTITKLLWNINIEIKKYFESIGLNSKIIREGNMTLIILVNSCGHILHAVIWTKIPLFKVMSADEIKGLFSLITTHKFPPSNYTRRKSFIQWEIAMWFRGQWD